MWPIYLTIALNLYCRAPQLLSPVFPGSCFYQRIFDKEKRIKRFVESRHVRIVTIGQLWWLRLWKVDNTMLREGGHQHPVSSHTTPETGWNYNKIQLISTLLFSSWISANYHLLVFKWTKTMGDGNRLSRFWNHLQTSARCPGAAPSIHFCTFIYQHSAANGKKTLALWFIERTGHFEQKY